MLLDHSSTRVLPLVLTGAVVARTVGPPIAHASDLPDAYAIQDEPLETGAITGTPLGVTPFSWFV